MAYVIGLDETADDASDRGQRADENENDDRADTEQRPTRGTGLSLGERINEK